MSEQAVSRVLFPKAVTRFWDNDHSSSLDVTIEIKRPTRELGRTTLKCSPIWSCSGWGLPSSRRHRRNWWALTSPFHPYPRLLSPGLGVTQHPVLRSPDFPPPCTKARRRSFVLLQHTRLKDHRPSVEPVELW